VTQPFPPGKGFVALGGALAPGYDPLVSPGFLSPSILFLSTWDLAERQFVAALSKRLLTAGYARIVEPCAGGFAMPAAHIQAGWPPASMECSDTCLFSAIVGGAVTGTDLRELDVRRDGEPVDIDGLEALDAGARLLFEQLDARMAMKPDHAYWTEIRRDLAYRRDEHLARLREGLRRSRELMAGMVYARLDLWEHMRRVADDPRTVISINPPTYCGGFEKFYDTGGSLTWNEPTYEMFDAAVDQDRLAQEARDWAALLLCQQQQTPGEASGDVVHARDLSHGQVVYVWSNRGDEVLKMLGRSAVVRTGALKRPAIPFLAPDHPVTTSSRVQIAKLTPPEIGYLKNLWLHKVDSSGGSWDFAIVIDGYLAGIVGVTAPQLQTWANQQGNLLLMFATACPHQERLTRLVTKLALSRSILRQVVEPWSMLQSDRIITAELTRLPEIKGLRGLMKLHDRKKDPKYGYRLIYRADIEDTTPGDCLAWWRHREDRWQKQRAKTAA
jgi:hypothetical protein